MKNTFPQKALCFCVLFLALNSRFSPAFAQPWNLTGNAGANPANGNFVGTTDNLPLELRVNGQRALRLEPTTTNVPNIIAGSPVNFVAPNVFGAVIAGGGTTLYTNSVSQNFSTVSGGINNKVLAAASTIVGGYYNQILIGADYSAIGGGTFNYVMTNSAYSSIGGGWGNAIQQNASDSTIAGGEGNVIQTGRNHGTISGGAGNVVAGAFGTIPGGDNNFVGASCFAAGSHAQASHANSFVWSDGTGGVFSTTAGNQFLIRATGNVGIGLNNPVAALHVASASSWPELQITQTNPNDYTRLRMNVTGKQAWEMDVSPSSTPALQFWNSTLRMQIDFNGNVSATSFNPSSDRNLKENISPISPREVLDKVAALPITRWNFKEDAATKHVGPMAQDFYAAFGVGLDDKHIATVDEGGVALAAIQGLNEKLQEELKRRDAENAELKRQLDQLKASVDAIRRESLVNR